MALLLATKRFGLLMLALAVVLVACQAPAASSVPSASESASASATATTALLSGVAPSDFFYPADDRVAGATPGKILASVEILAPAGMRAWTVVYGSTGLDGEPVAVSGMILAPAEAPLDATYPIVAWAHGTTGIADDCAPSREGVNGIPSPLRGLVAQGYVVVATDYEGLGTDGSHPYLVGISEGRSVLDSIRALHYLPEAQAATEAVVIGHSQGGHAALWAAELAGTYAPDLGLLGAVATSPPTDLAAWHTWAFERASAGEIAPALAPLLLYGDWNDVYGLSLDFLTDTGRKAALVPRDGCFDPDPGGLPYLADPALRPDWGARLTENSPGAERTRVPMLVVSPEGDDAVQYDTQVAGVTRMCDVGDTVELRTVSGDHNASIEGLGAWEALSLWITDRFAGVAPISTC